MPAVAACLALAAVAGCGGRTAKSDPATPLPAQVTDALTDLVGSGLPAAQAVISGPEGTRTATAGTGYVEGSHFRIGSVTKSFVATVVLQLVGEGSVELEAPIEKYLPGVVQGNGNDGNRITVHQLLQHTSGLADFAPEDPSEKQPQQLDQMSDGKAYRDLGPADLVGIAMTMPPQFEPGAQFRYTNTNYVLLGMMVERLTGRPLATEISRRILDPLAMRDTYLPVPGETGLREPHPTGFHKVDGTWADITDIEAAWTGAAGAIVSTGPDLNRFTTALITGKLLPQAQLDLMKNTVPMTPDGAMAYGLGLIRLQLPCQNRTAEAWGHAGGIPGFSTLAVATPGGTAIAVSVNTEETNDHFSPALTAIVCAVA
ncbi:serine hydrolase domain-containing protein [Nocardia terrae]|uniref:serine hydrolase domain-containing protein n=1 Tax=Nocardia terrae TaxID=2675851 RepID=UPI002E274AFD